MLSVKNVNAGYHKVTVIRDINIDISRGEIVTIIGANGAGKTTLFRVISGFLSPFSGEVIYKEKNIGGSKPHKVARMGVGQVPEGRQVVQSLSVRDHLQLSAHYGGRYKSKGEIAEKLQDIYTLFPVLKEKQNQSAGSLSGGQQQMLVIARALMLEPDILLLDEPSLGLAPLIVADIFKTLTLLNNQGMTIILIEQNAFSALKISHRAYVMEYGKVVHEEQADILSKDPAIEKYYLG